MTQSIVFNNQIRLATMDSLREILDSNEELNLTFKGDFGYYIPDQITLGGDADALWQYLDNSVPAIEVRPGLSLRALTQPIKVSARLDTHSYLISDGLWAIEYRHGENIICKPWHIVGLGVKPSNTPHVGIVTASTNVDELTRQEYNIVGKLAFHYNDIDMLAKEAKIGSYEPYQLATGELIFANQACRIYQRVHKDREDLSPVLVGGRYQLPVEIDGELSVIVIETCRDRNLGRDIREYAETRRFDPRDVKPHRNETLIMTRLGRAELAEVLSRLGFKCRILPSMYVSGNYYRYTVDCVIRPEVVRDIEAVASPAELYPGFTMLQCPGLDEAEVTQRLYELGYDAGCRVVNFGGVHSPIVIAYAGALPSEVVESFANGILPPVPETLTEFSTPLTNSKVRKVLNSYGYLGSLVKVNSTDTRHFYIYRGFIHDTVVTRLSQLEANSLRLINTNVTSVETPYSLTQVKRLLANHGCVNTCEDVSRPHAKLNHILIHGKLDRKLVSTLKRDY